MTQLQKYNTKHLYTTLRYIMNVFCKLYIVIFKHQLTHSLNHNTQWSGKFTMHFNHIYCYIWHIQYFFFNVCKYQQTTHMIVAWNVYWLLLTYSAYHDTDYNIICNMTCTYQYRTVISLLDLWPSHRQRKCYGLSGYLEQLDWMLIKVFIHTSAVALSM